jgi:hypothetical protein
MSAAPQSNTFPDVSLTTSDYVYGANNSLLAETLDYNVGNGALTWAGSNASYANMSGNVCFAINFLTSVGFVAVIWPPSPNVSSYVGVANMISVQTGSYDAAILSRFPGPNRIFITPCLPINSWYHLTQYKSDMPLHDIATGAVVAMMAGQPGDRNGSASSGKIVQMRPDANTTFFVTPFPAEGSA